MTDREKLAGLIYDNSPMLVEEEANALANRLISNGVVVRENGEWVWDKKFGDYKCSICGGYDITVPAFCRTCGSDMR